jgi:hypothetical protein
VASATQLMAAGETEVQFWRRPFLSAQQPAPASVLAMPEREQKPEQHLEIVAYVRPHDQGFHVMALTSDAASQKLQTNQ